MNDAPASLAGQCTCAEGSCAKLGQHFSASCRRARKQLGWERAEEAACGATVPPQTCPSQSLPDLLTPAVLAAQPKSGLRAALGLLLQELNRRGSPAYGDLVRNPALLAEQVSPFAASYLAAVEADRVRKGSGATDSPSANLPPEVIIITPGDLLPNADQPSLCANSAGILQLKKGAE